MSELTKTRIALLIVRGSGTAYLQIINWTSVGRHPNFISVSSWLGKEEPAINNMQGGSVVSW
jgi:hypothetical protein